MSDVRPSDPMLRRLRILASATGNEFLGEVADRLEQLQLPHAEVLRIAEINDEGADVQATVKALCRKVEAQRREIVRLQEQRP